MYAAITPGNATTWNPKDLMVISDDSKPCRLTLQPTNNPSHFTWRSKHAFTVTPSMSSPVAYFEITAKHWVTIGICHPTYPIDKVLPGERPDSAVFHGGDGTFRLGQSTTRQPFAAPWREGDRIGCGVKLRTGAVFFTVNGDSIGAATFAPEGSWNFCIGSHNVWDDQTVTIHLSPADWMFDPFVKLSVLMCNQCLNIEYPGCRTHRCILTNFSPNLHIAWCQYPPCITTLHWTCRACRQSGLTLRALYIREREVRLIASNMLRIKRDSLLMRCRICSGCNALEFPALGPRTIDHFKHFGRCQLAPESVDIKLLISEAAYISERFLSTLNATGPSVFAGATPELEGLVGDVDFDTIEAERRTTVLTTHSWVKQLPSYSALKTELRKPGYAILQLYKDWSESCARIAPFYHLSNRYSEITYYRIKNDLPGMRGFVNQHNVKSYPTFLIMESGRVINTIVGADKEALTEVVNELVIDYDPESPTLPEPPLPEPPLQESLAPPIRQVTSQITELEPKRVSLPYLPPEIFEQIVENLVPQDYTLLPIDVVAFSLVCKYWHHIAQNVLSDSVFDNLVLTSSYEFKSILRISDLLSTARVLYPSYSNSITTLSLHLDLLFSQSVEFLRLLSLSPNLHTLKLFLFNSTSLSVIGELDDFLEGLQPFYAKITTLHFETGPWWSLEKLDPLISRTVSSFKPTVHTLSLRHTPLDTRIPDAFPMPKRLKHFQCDLKHLHGPFPFKPMPDPIHCFIEGICLPTMFTFAFDEETEYDLQMNSLDPDNDEIASDNDGIVSGNDWQLRCRRLQTLCITGDIIDGDFLLRLALNARKLERLVLRPVFLRIPEVRAEYSGWEGVSWTSMRVLDLEWCLGVDPVFLAVFMEVCPNLNEVRLEASSLECEEVMLGQGFHKSDTEGSTVKWQR